MVNPLEEIKKSINEFANTSADFSGMTPEKMIDIPNQKDKDDDKRDDFDVVMDPVVKNLEKIEK